MSISAQAPSSESTSSIEKVTVFLNGAQVHRKSQVPLQKGVQEITFTGLSAQVDPSSIRVSLPADVMLLSVLYQVDHLSNRSEPEAHTILVDSIELLNQSIAEQQVVQQSIQEEINFLKKNSELGSTQQGIQYENYQRIHSYYAENVRSLLLDHHRIGQQIKAWEEKRQKLLRRLQHIQKPTQHFGELVVKVKSDRSYTAKVAFHYYTLGASWYASYDLRADDLDDPLTLVYQANVRQETGVDWKEVSLTFSNADPMLSAQIPELLPMRLGRTSQPHGVRQLPSGSGASGISGQVQDETYGESLFGATVIAQQNGHQVSGTVTDIDGQFALNLTPGTYDLLVQYVGYAEYLIQGVTVWSQQMTNVSVGLNQSMSLEEVVVVSSQDRSTMETSRRSRQMGAQEKSKLEKSKQKEIPTGIANKTTSVELTLAIPFSVPSDGKNYTANVKTYRIPVTYRYRAIPKLDEHAYLMASVTDWDTLHLLPGTAKLYFENTYVGKSVIDPSQSSDTLTWSLGIDKSIQIKRNRIQEYRKRRFLGDRKSETLGFEIVVRNGRTQSINLKVIDQVPLSTRKDIEVSQDKISGATYDKDTGSLTWDVQLAPGQEKKWGHQYTVTYPKHLRLSLD